MYKGFSRLSPFVAVPLLAQLLALLARATLVIPLSWTEPVLDGIPTRTYYLEVSVGTPAQPLKLVLDMHYSAVMLETPDFCASARNGTEFTLTSACFSPDNSTTFVNCSSSVAATGSSAGDSELISLESSSSLCSGLNSSQACIETNNLLGLDTLQLFSIEPTSAVVVVDAPFFFVNSTASYPLNPNVFRGLSGRFGLAQPDVDSSMNLVNQLLQTELQNSTALPWIVLSLNSSATSSLQIGGYTGLEEPMWSETNYLAGCSAANYYAYYVAAFHLSVCDEDIVEDNPNYDSSQIMLAVDLNEPCLVLPDAFLMSLEAWLPINCSAGLVNGTGLRCSLNDTIVHYGLLDKLPPITFQLAEDGPTVYIPLQNLVLENSSLCLRAFEDFINLDVLPSAGSYDLYYLPATFGVLGTLALESFDVIFDWSTNRTGFVQKGDPSMWSNRTCASSLAPTCRGIEFFVSAYNYCGQPDCTVYLFQEFDPDTAQCVPSLALKIAIMLIVLAFSVIEIFQSLRYRSVVKRLFSRPVAES